MKKFLLISFFSTLSFFLFSQTEQIENLQRQQLLLQEEIKNTNKLYLDVKKHTSTILDRINLINKQINARKELVNVHKREIEELNREEKKIEREIDRLNKELKTKQDNYANAIKGMLNQKHNHNKLLFILSGKSLGESLRRMQYLKEYSKWQKAQATDIKKQNEEINVKKEALIKAKKDKEISLAALIEEQNKLQSEEKTRQSEIAQARGQEKKLQQSIREKQRQSDQLNNQIEKLIAEEVARLEREEEARRRAEAAKKVDKKEEVAERKSDEEVEERTVAPGPRIERSTSTTSAESFELSKDFASNKGKLPMPVTGTSTIVGAFGTKQHSEWNITTNSNGIDIQSEQGANIRTVFDGVVSKVFSFPGSNTCVIVRHGDYYTFYANIYDLFVKQGDKVKTGQSLGRIFTDPDTNVSRMHFQLWNKTVKQNPTPWLSRK